VRPAGLIPLPRGRRRKTLHRPATSIVATPKGTTVTPHCRASIPDKFWLGHVHHCQDGATGTHGGPAGSGYVLADGLWSPQTAQWAQYVVLAAVLAGAGWTVWHTGRQPPIRTYIAAVRPQLLPERTPSRRRRTAVAVVTVAAVAAAAFGPALYAHVVLGTQPLPQYAIPFGLRATPDPALNQFADRLTDAATDHKGHYLYAETRSAYTAGGSVKVTVSRWWQEDDGSGAQVDHRFLVPIGDYRPAMLRDTTLTAAYAGAVTSQRFPTTDPADTPPGQRCRIATGAATSDLATTDPAVVMATAPRAQAAAGFAIACRRILLRTLAALDGSIIAGPAADPLGRWGIAITLASSGRCQQLIVDARTGLLLAYTDRLDGPAADSRPAGASEPGDRPPPTATTSAAGQWETIVYAAITRTDSGPTAADLNEQSAVPATSRPTQAHAVIAPGRRTRRR